MAKKLPEVDRVWAIVSSDGYLDVFPTFLSAEKKAKNYLDEDGTVDGVYIFEVVRAWRVDFPEEPQVETREVFIGTLP